MESLQYSYSFAAGDFVKFGFPITYTATVQSWGLVDYELDYSSAGLYMVVMVKVKTQNVRFGTKNVARARKEIASV